MMISPTKNAGRELLKQLVLLKNLYKIRGEQDRPILWPSTDTPQFDVAKAQRFMNSEYYLRIQLRRPNYSIEYR